jgi:hypothetical protein
VLDNFPEFAAKVKQRYDIMSNNELFTVDVPDIFDTYLSAFPEGTNELFRERTEHDCNCCKQFIRRLGKVVSIEDGKVVTVWDIPGLPYPYDVVARRLHETIIQQPIQTVFRTKERQYGTEYNWDTHDHTIQWKHFWGRVGNKHYSLTPDTARSNIEAAAQVFKRGLEELKPEAFDTVVELIEQNQLYRGEEHLAPLREFRRVQRLYLESPNKSTFVWENIANRAARFRNTVIGTLLVDLSEGVDEETAIRSFEQKVAPYNYKRPTAAITPKMIENAVKILREMGLEQSIERRMAKITDVSVNNVLFVDNSVQGQMKDGIEGLLLESVKPKSLEIKNAQPIPVADFFERVVPNAKSIQLQLTNKHLGNFVTLTAPVHENTGRLFKWNNDFAWSYDGEVTDSIKQRVKKAGGNVEADLRVSLAWHNTDDLDIHVYEPSGRHIYFGDKAGILDVDMNVSQCVRDPVENISYLTRSLMDGLYTIKVNNFTKRESTDVGFQLEVEREGVVEQFSYDKALRNKETVTALALEIRDRKVKAVKPLTDLVGGTIPTVKWGLTTGQLVKVDTIMLSPNHWDEQQVGNRHYFFMLKDCRNPDPVRGIFNEYLRGELEGHRKVFETLGAKTKAQPSHDQLSGLGFSSTKRDEITAIVDNKAYLVQF